MRQSESAGLCMYQFYVIKIVIFIAAKLNSCKEEIVNVIGDTIPEHIVSQAVVKHQYNIQAALNELLSQSGMLSILQLDY